MATEQDFTITKGDTFVAVIRWEDHKWVFKPITAIERSAPARVTAVGHECPDGWRAAVVSAKGMTQINASSPVPKDDDLLPITQVDVDTVEFGDVNSSDYSPYTSGGYLAYRKPVDITGFGARMHVRDKVTGELLMALTTADGRISIDPVARTITLALTALDTSDILWKKGVYDLEMVSPDDEPVVSKLYYGSVYTVKEFTV